jgi:flagellar biosynthesis GTPase FlhF
MQIKRFEAEDMTEALRMVKREFGDDAVILSAKESRPGGIFSAFRKKCVEITAATDYPVEDAGSESDFSRQLSEQLDCEMEKENDRVSLSSKPSAFIPMSASKPAKAVDDPPQPALSKDRSTELRHNRQAAETRTRGPLQKPAGNASSHDRDVEKITAMPFYRNGSKRKIIALVGGHGAGKSTAIAKLARHCCTIEKKTVALVSLDRFRLDANGLLQTVSKIMNLPFAVARDRDQLHRVLEDQLGVDIILIDTPGVGPADTMMVDDIARLLGTASPDETHLVVNATVRHTVLDRLVKALQPAGIDHLFFTHMDEYGVDDSMLELIQAHALPSAFYTDGVDIFDHLKESSADGLERFWRSISPKRKQVADFSAKKISSVGEKTNSVYNDKKTHFVANRNSELFHHPDCKSVKRINAENITSFSSIERALEQGFKPCRACCNNEIIKNAVPSVFAHRRVSAI